MYEELKEITKEELTINPGKFAAMANNGYKLDSHAEEITFVNFIDKITTDAAEAYIPIHIDDALYTGDQEGVSRTVVLGDDDKALFVVLGWAATDSVGQVDHRQGITTNVSNADDELVQAWHYGQAWAWQNFTDLEHVNTIALGQSGQSKEQKLHTVLTNQLGKLVDFIHYASHVYPLSEKNSRGTTTAP